MCMPYCWLCCLCCTTVNCFESAHPDFKIRCFWFAIWGLFNYIYFTCLSSDFFTVILEIFYSFHLSIIFKCLIWILLIINLSKVINKSRIISAHESNIFFQINFSIVFLNFFIYPINSDNFSLIISILPILLQLYLKIYFFNAHSETGTLIFWWVIGWMIDYIKFGFIWDYIVYFATLFFTYFFEYPVVIGCSVMVAYQMNQIIEKIERFNEMFHYRGKSKRQIVGYFFKEILNYCILAASCCVVYYCEGFLEEFHGYSSSVISLVADLTCCFPVVVLLRYPKENGLGIIERNRRDFRNLVAVGFSISFYKIMFWGLGIDWR